MTLEVAREHKASERFWTWGGEAWIPVGAVPPAVGFVHWKVSRESWGQRL